MGFFDEHQRRTIEAAMARIIPSDGGPGAREAGAIDFLDGYLSGLDRVYAKADGGGFVELRGKARTAWQTRLEGIRRRYLDGVDELDRRSRERFGQDFHRLTAPEQDDVLRQLESPDMHERMDEKATEGFAPTPRGMQQVPTEHGLDFFGLLVLHTRQGFYADPIYGGNRDHVGWKWIGFEGPASLADVKNGRYTTLPYFADGEPSRPDG